MSVFIKIIDGPLALTFESGQKWVLRYNDGLDAISLSDGLKLAQVEMVVSRALDQLQAFFSKFQSNAAKEFDFLIFRISITESCSGYSVRSSGGRLIKEDHGLPPSLVSAIVCRLALETRYSLSSIAHLVDAIRPECDERSMFACL